MGLDLFKEVQKVLAAKAHDGMPELPQKIQTFLGRLCLLQNIPIYYLVPAEKYIEKECINFFLLDSGWIECLVNGATSVIEDAETRNTLLQKAMDGRYALSVLKNDANDRIVRQISGLHADAGSFNSALLAAQARLPDSSAWPKSLANWNFSGFIMRSALISTWVGIEITARGTVDNGTAKISLPIARFDRIADDTILCVCLGLVTEVDIKQPTETLHFGITDGIPRNELGVVDIATIISSRLITKEKSDPEKTTFPVNNSREFARAMLAAPLHVAISIDWKGQKQNA